MAELRTFRTRPAAWKNVEVTNNETQTWTRLWKNFILPWKFMTPFFHSHPARVCLWVGPRLQMNTGSNCTDEQIILLQTQTYMQNKNKQKWRDLDCLVLTKKVLQLESSRLTEQPSSNSRKKHARGGTGGHDPCNKHMHWGWIASWSAHWPMLPMRHLKETPPKKMSCLKSAYFTGSVVHDTFC
jgi:hypothetical protein